MIPDEFSIPPTARRSCQPVSSLANQQSCYLKTVVNTRTRPVGCGSLRSILSVAACAVNWWVGNGVKNAHAADSCGASVAEREGGGPRDGLTTDGDGGRTCHGRMSLSRGSGSHFNWAPHVGQRLGQAELAITGLWLLSSACCGAMGCSGWYGVWLS